MTLNIRILQSLVTFAKRYEKKSFHVFFIDSQSFIVVWKPNPKFKSWNYSTCSSFKTIQNYLLWHRQIWTWFTIWLNYRCRGVVPGGASACQFHGTPRAQILADQLKFIFSEKATQFWLVLHTTKVRWRFRNILWPSQNMWTLYKHTISSWDTSY